MEGYNKKYLQKTKTVYNEDSNKENIVKSIYFGEVISIIDENDGGRIKVRVPDIDRDIPNSNLVQCYPILPKFFWNYPKVGEMVRIFFDDIKHPQQGRHWMGSVISQPQKIKKDEYYTALSTTNVGLSRPEPAISTNPDAINVFPSIEDIALVGRNNTDVILREREVEIRCGKHEFDNILMLNKKNPAFIRLNFEDKGERSSIIEMADKIALLTHGGDPKFKNNNITKEDRDKIFNEGHPMVRGDYNVLALNLIRKVLLSHVHGYSSLPPDKNSLIRELENADFNKILSNNIVIN